MPNKLFLRPLSPQAQEDEYLFDWALYDVAGQQRKLEMTKGVESITQTLMQNGIDVVDVIVLWPSASAFSTSVMLPGNQSRYVHQALPFAIEEQLAQDLGSVHLGIGDKHKSYGYPVIGVDQLAFAALYDLLLDQDLFRLKAICIDADCLNSDERDMVVSVGSDMALIKTPERQVIGLNKQNIVAYLDAYTHALAEEEVETENKHVTLFVESSEEEKSKILLAELAQYPKLEIDTKVVDLTQFELLCESYLQSSVSPINLCQGEFKVVQVGSSQWEKWRGVAAVLLIAFVVQLGVFVGKGYHYQSQANQIAEQALSEYKKLVPGSRSVSVDKLARVIKGKLNQSRSQGGTDAGFLQLLGEAGFQYQNSQDKADLSFQSVNFNAQRGELVIELQAKNFEQLDRLKQAIAGVGLSAKISSAVQEQGFYRGRLSVSGS